MAKPKRAESGFALLMIFCMAAMVAILLYTAMPRAAFEAQRDREQLLIDRGEQYKRAIQLYYRAVHRYPAKMEDLENTNNQRFLRRRYLDPMTGKEEWRLIHVGPGGVLTDSVNVKKKKVSQGSVNTFITELPQIGGPDPSVNGAGANVGLRRRASELAGAPGAPGGPLPTEVAPDPNTIAQNAAASVAGVGPQQFAPNGQPMVGVGPAPGGLSTVGGPVPPVNSGYPNPTGNLGNGYPNPTGAYAVQITPGNAATGGVGAVVPSVSPGANPGASPVTGPIPPNSGVPGSNPAAAMIQNMLTRPRPGGFPGSNPQGGNVPPGPGTEPEPPSANLGLAAQTGGSQPTPSAFANSGQGQTVGGGFAGVASKSERDAIKIYNDKSKYNEWEFIYDYAKDTAGGVVPNGRQGNQQTNQQGNQQGLQQGDFQSQQPNFPGFPGRR